MNTNMAIDYEELRKRFANKEFRFDFEEFKKKGFETLSEAFLGKWLGFNEVIGESTHLEHRRNALLQILI